MRNNLMRDVYIKETVSMHVTFGLTKALDVDEISRS